MAMNFMMTAIGEDNLGGESEAEKCEVPDWELSASENHSITDDETKESGSYTVKNTISLDEHSDNNQNLDALQPSDNSCIQEIAREGTNGRMMNFGV